VFRFAECGYSRYEILFVEQNTSPHAGMVGWNGIILELNILTVNL